MIAIKILALSKEELLDVGLKMIQDCGLNQFTIRSFAAHAGVAVGTVYNYFGTKEDLLKTLMDTYWRRTIQEQMDLHLAPQEDFFVQLEKIFLFIGERSEEFHREFIKSGDRLRLDNPSVEDSMNQFVQMMEKKLMQVIGRYPLMRAKIEALGTVEEFCQMILDHMIARATHRKKDLGIFRLILQEAFE